jgi:2-amino-4-hydroxy-6-hydroxymethyldihydropteridine diphosphokinase
VTDFTCSYVGIGSNLGDPVEYVEAGISALAHLRDSRLVARSSLYRSAPIGVEDQPDFVNAACRIDTWLTPQALLHELLAFERAHGRTRGSVHASPRTLDLDILLYGELQLTSGPLTIPHPRLRERAFVLCPLSEIAPTLEIPGHPSMSVLLSTCAAQVVTRIAANTVGEIASR